MSIMPLTSHPNGVQDAPASQRQTSSPTSFARLLESGIEDGPVRPVRPGLVDARPPLLENLTLQSIIGRSTTADMCPDLGSRTVEERFGHETSFEIRRAVSPPPARAAEAPAQPTEAVKKARPKTQSAKAAGRAPSRLDALSSGFESGSGGVGAIGFDRGGGTSYGKYQISSRAGTLQRFINYLDAKAPDLAERLKAGGSGDTGSTEGGMPDAWRAIAEEDPKRFETLQHDFILKTHYLPALRRVTEETGINIGERSQALKEVLWSTAVQHGPNRAVRIFTEALAGLDVADPDFDRTAISNVFDSRRTQFAASSKAMRTAINARYRQEEILAVSMHNSNPKDPISVL